MTEQYIYGQQIYGQDNIQYETTGVEGAQFGTYGASNYQQEQNLNLDNLENLNYQEIQAQPIYLNEKHIYTQPGQETYLQQNKPEQYNFETNLQGYENYFQNQVQQPQQQNIQYFQQNQTIQQPQNIQNQKYVQQTQTIEQQKYLQQPQTIQQQKYAQQPQSIQQLQQQQYGQQAQSIQQQQQYIQQQQNILQQQYAQQPNNIQQQKFIQQQANMTRQMAHHQPNVKPYSNMKQPTFPSRNPHIKQQYQLPNNMPQMNQPQMNQPQMNQPQMNQPQMNQPQMNQPQQGQNLNEMKYDNQPNYQLEKPSIEPDFIPSIPLANSVLSQSKIPFQPNQNVPINPQAQQPPKPMQSNNMMPQQSNIGTMRNPNYNLQQYGYMNNMNNMNNNNSHFVTTANPDWGYNEANPLEPKQDIKKKNSEEPLTHKESGLSHKSLEHEQEQLLNKKEEPGVDTNIKNNSSVQNVGIPMSSVQNIGNSEIGNVGVGVGLNNTNNIEANIDANENPLESKITNEEFPIEEKMPEQNNVNENNNYQEDVNKNPLEGSVDIDDNLEHLPTVNSIMKGRAELLPPPKKKKYK